MLHPNAAAMRSIFPTLTLFKRQLVFTVLVERVLLVAFQSPAGKAKSVVGLGAGKVSSPAAFLIPVACISGAGR
jgi:hypothetical protein